MMSSPRIGSGWRSTLVWLGSALFLASLGIYAVMSFTVAQNASEIGLRIALGATESEVMRRVLNQGLEMELLQGWRWASLARMLQVARCKVASTEQARWIGGR